MLVDFDSPTPMRFRLQNGGGQLGPEIYFKMPPFRSFTPTTSAATRRITSSPSRKIPGARKFHSSRASLRKCSPGPFIADNSRSCRWPRPTLRNAACCGRMSTATAGPTCWWPNRRAARSPFISSRPTVAGIAKKIPSAGGREPDGGGGFERRWPAGNFSPEPGRTRGWRDKTGARTAGCRSRRCCRWTESR